MKYTRYYSRVLKANGNLWREGIVKDGKKNGVWKEYYDNQLKREVTYKDGKMDGVRKWWHKMAS